MKRKLGDTRFFKVPYSFSSEGRVFYEDEIYKAEYMQWTEDELSVYLYAENGYFNFTPELFERVVKGWKLEEVAK